MKTFKLIFSLTFIVMFFAALSLQSQNNFHNTHYQDPYNPAYDTGVVLVKFKDNVDMKVYKNGKGIAQTGYASVDKFLEQYEAKEMKKVFSNAQKRTTKKTFSFGGEVHEVPQLFNIYKIELNTKTTTEQMVEELQADPLVEYAEPDYLVYTQEDKSGQVYEPNDPLYQDGSQWYLDAINAPEAWEITTGDTSQVIGIIDTGVDWDHPDLDDNIWTNWDEIPDNGIDDDGNGYVDDVRGWDFINEDNDPNDDNSHGTHVAGIAAAEGNNGTGIIGVAPDAQIMPVKMFQSSGVGNSSDLASAIQYAGENGATVINYSGGSYGESLTVKTALENAYAGTGDGEGSMLVAAAGNSSYKIDRSDPCKTYGDRPKPSYPGCYSFVIGVMAQDAGPCEGFSNWDFTGPINSLNQDFNYEIQSPGVGIISCKPNGYYWQKSGTSMATPEVAGAVALMRHFQPEQSGEQIFSKLIQGSDEGVMDIENSLTIALVPDLYYVDYVLIDECEACDEDDAPDAGETIDIYLEVKNAGGHADSAWTKLRLREFEDETVADVIDSTSYIGDMSAYATLSGELDHFQLSIAPDVINDRDVVLEYEIGCANSEETVSGEIVIRSQNGEELLGVLDSTLVLLPDKLWLVNNSFKVGTNGTLIIKPGVTLKLNQKLVVKGQLIAEGTKDSLIKIHGPFGIYGQDPDPPVGLNGQNTDTVLFRYVRFSDIQNMGDISAHTIYNMYNAAFYNCQFKNNNTTYLFYKCYNLMIKDCEIFNNNLTGLFVGSSSGNIEQANIYNNNFSDADGVGLDGYCIVDDCNFSNLSPVVFGNQRKFNGELIKSNFLTSNETPIVHTDNYNDIVSYPNNYWGTTKNELIDQKIVDFFDDPSFAMLDYDPILIQPSDSAHGCVWKVEIEGVDPQDEVLDPLGVGTYQFDVYFNKCMDTAFTPMLSFGVRDPHTQHVVSDNGVWSADSTIWSATYDVGQETGDGINYVRVSSAVDTAGFDIPVEDNERFAFVAQAAGAQSINFLATPGIGKVDLEWPPATTDDALGYNLYRFHNLTDSTYSDTTLINTELVLDTLYTDFNVIPDTSYHYLYKTVGTDMAETDYSKSVQATPFTAANGDANGSMSVNVLDITTIVNYMLGNAPEPFLFDAADVNYDGSINVLDIIGVVQIIQGNKSVPLSKIIATNTNPAYISKEGKTIQLESEGNVAALSFELQGEELDKLKLLSKAKGFEFALCQSDSLIKGVMYSLSGSTIPEGKVTLFEATKPLTATTFGALTGGDWEGNYVPVLKEGEELPTPESYQLQAYPNPFTGQTTIQYDLPEQSDVTITIYDMSGKLVWQQQKNNLQAGNYEYLWNSSDSKGMYLLTIQAKGATQKWEKQVKLLQLK